MLLMRLLLLLLQLLLWWGFLLLLLRLRLLGLLLGLALFFLLVLCSTIRSNGSGPVWCLHSVLYSTTCSAAPMSIAPPPGPLAAPIPSHCKRLATVQRA